MTQSEKLTCLVIGAGLGGLAAAISIQRADHHAIVLEAAPKLGEIGAGIQLTPNVTRLLDAWGLGEEIARTAVHPETIWFRRWQDGKKIAKTALVPEFERDFGARYYVAHRAHLHDALHRKALELGAEVRVDSRVDSIDFDAPNVTLHTGEVVSGDLVIGADGIKSLIRARMLADPKDAPRPTRFCAYRALVPTELMRRDADLANLLEKSELNVWIGQDVHAMTYCVSRGEMFNLVLSHKDDRPVEQWSTDRETLLKEMRATYKGWDPVLVKVVNLIESTSRWPLMVYPCMDKWVHDSGKVVLLGDACHAMLPYMSQGAAQAIEDAATLGACLARASSTSAALSAYEALRVPRAREVQDRSAENGRRWHFADGPDQIARDEGSRAEVEGKPFTESTNQWSDPKVSKWLYGHDVDAAVTGYFKGRAGPKVNGINGVNGHA